MSHRLTPIAAAIALALASSAASAVDFSLRGYGTAGVVHSDNDEADFSTSQFIQPEGVGYSDNPSFKLDSKVGLQLDMVFNERWSAVVQIVSQDGYGNSWDNSNVVDDFTPSLEWANVSWRATDNLTLRAGRVVLPFLMMSDSIKVGYANHWLRAPIEAYYELPFFTSDGGDVAYKSSWGSTFNTFRAHYGVQKQVREEAANDVTLWGVNDTLEIGSLVLRAAYLKVEFESDSTDLTNLFQGFAGMALALGQTQAAAEALRLQSIYDVAEKQEVELFNVGASYDAGAWFVMGEANRVTSEGVQTGSNGGYLSGGLRRGAFTPYATLSRARSKDRNESLVPLNGFVPLFGAAPPTGPMAQAAFGMGMGINSFVGAVTAISGQTTSSLGLRWDAANNIAVKLQLDHVDLDEGSVGRFLNVQPAFEPGGTVNVYSVAVDFVF